MKDISGIRTNRLKKLIYIGASVAGLLLFVSIISFFVATYGRSISFAFVPGKKQVDFTSIIGTLSFTLAQALLSLALAFMVALPGAFLLSRRKFIFSRTFMAFACVPLCIPPLIVALGYISTFGVSGLMNKLLFPSNPTTFLYSFWGLVLCQGFYNFPLIMMTLSNSWSTMDQAQGDAARLLGASEGRIFLTITLPSLSGAIASACIPVFIYCFFSFMIVQLFAGMDGTTLEVAIYHAGKSSIDFHKVSILGLVETAVAFAVIAMYGCFEKKFSHSKNISLVKGMQEKKKLSISETFFAIVYCIIVFAFFILPFLCILISSFSQKSKTGLSFSTATWSHLFKMKGFSSALKNTFFTATCTATLCTAAGFFYSLLLKTGFFIKSKNPFERSVFFTTLPLLPMAVSSVLIGLGLTMSAQRGTVFLLILCQTSLSWPFAFRQIHSEMQRIPQDTISASRILCTDSMSTIYEVIVPYSKKGILSAWGFSFAISAGDATLPLVLGVPRFDTLSLFTYRLASSYRLNEACAAGLLLGAVCMTVFLLTNGHSFKLKKRSKT